ncbi:adenylate/guanylate cyclase domain-containing protein [Micromonospora sp. WMMA1363]|uniref:adenylate/guanylate cyclase domain-containing protein n=1 Tax=Micromonospora sp. WMMA1363 TaxID=3053985 RepID=UPI00259CEDF0|nr:adenylate/guanylate cyclase domain-containing protein [Micromonospora sp. WMMA1363]MDM4718979.1 adenylate/guanylate cyclase domain-containing protein [Micromonospora sp. WMMA1363]
MYTTTASPRHADGRLLAVVPPPPTGRVAEPPAHWPLPEERRTVTVLFADIVGSTALIDRLDPEDVRALQRAYFDTVAGVLEHWRGVVEKYVGDAVMALFGARESDGFDAYRAVRAGLEIQRSLDRRSLLGGPALRIRVGVATGEAVVDLAATRDGAHGTASGAVITLAARLQEYAPAGGVALCAATHQATNGLIEQRPVPPVAVAGKALPLEVWHATAATRPTPARHGGPLIGRRRELATVRDQLVRAVRERQPRWVSVAGPAGSGRSRLLHEVIRAVQAVDGTPVRWCRVSCPPYPEEALAPVADQVRAFAGVRAGDPSPVVRGRLTAAVSELVPAARRTEAVYALEGLLARPDAGTHALRGAAVWQECLLALAERQPVAVAVDDLDRGAPELGHFLHRLLAGARTRALPLAVVALHVPEWADARTGDRNHRCRLSLRRLSSVEAGRLLRHLLHRAGKPAALVTALLPLVGGNPGRAAAYVAALPDGGAVPARPPLPDPVRRSVDARLDRLDGQQRAVLMAAAAVGAPVDADTVDHLIGWSPGRAVAALRQLVERDLLAARPGGYAVGDPLVATVAAARLTRTVRAELLTRAGHRSGPSAPRPVPPTRSPVDDGPDPTPDARRIARPDGPGVRRAAGAPERASNGRPGAFTRPVATEDGMPGPAPAVAPSWPIGQERVRRMTGTVVGRPGAAAASGQRGPETRGSTLAAPRPVLATARRVERAPAASSAVRPGDPTPRRPATAAAAGDAGPATSGSPPVGHVRRRPGATGPEVAQPRPATGTLAGNVPPRPRLSAAPSEPARRRPVGSRRPGEPGAATEAVPRRSGLVSVPAAA